MIAAASRGWRTSEATPRPRGGGPEVRTWRAKCTCKIVFCKDQSRKICTVSTVSILSDKETRESTFKRLVLAALTARSICAALCHVFLSALAVCLRF